MKLYGDVEAFVEVKVFTRFNQFENCLFAEWYDGVKRQEIT